MIALLAVLLASPSVHVIAVGHNGAIGDGRAALRYADDDAARFFELVAPGAATATLLTVLDPDSQRIYPDLVAKAGAPTMKAVEAAVGQVRAAIAADAKAGRKSVLYWFYAGHGNVEDGEGYVGLEGGRLTRRALRRLIIEGTGADRTHVIIDACKSYFLVGGRGPGGSVTPYRAAFAGPEAPPGVGFVLSTSSDAESHEWGAIPGGVFSHEIRSAFVGAADATGDGAIDYEELAAFVGIANDSVPVDRYRPRVWIRPPRADARAVIFAPKTVPGSTRLELAPARAGRVQIVDQRGLRYLDMHKAPGAKLAVSLLAPRRYEVRAGSDAWTVQADGRPLRLADAPRAELTIAARSEAHRAYSKLFAAPFGADALRGFRVGQQNATQIAPIAPASDWVTPTLVGGGALGLAVGAGLGFLAVDANGEANRAPQADRPGLADDARALSIGAGVAVGVGVTALAVAAWRYWFAE